MESQPQNPEFRNNPENFHPCECYLASKSEEGFSHNEAHIFLLDIV